MSQGDAFDRIVASLHQAALDDAHWPRASALMDDALHSKGNLVGFSSGRSNRDLRIFLVRFLYRGERREDLEREYLNVYHPLDEWVPRVRQLPDSQLVHMADLYTEEELKTSVAYNEAHSRGHTQNGLNVRLDGPDGSRIVWVFADPVDKDGWSSGRTDLIRRLLPHLRHYVCVRQALAEAGGLGASLTGLLEKIASGIIQLDGRGRIVAANDRALALLREGDGLFDHGGFLFARSPEEDAELQELLTRALPPFGGRGVGGSMTVRRSTVLPGLSLHVSPVREGEKDFRARGVAALVLVVDRESGTRIDPVLVETALGLTPAESRVAVLLAEGRTVRDIAAATGRKVSTIRTHVKHVFAKHGLSRQMDLVRLVLSLASAPDSRGQRGK